MENNRIGEGSAARKETMFPSLRLACVLEIATERVAGEETSQLVEAGF